MSTLVLRRVAIASIRPDPQNARTHDETNVAATVARWEKATGKRAVIEATGRGFAETAEERGVA